MSGSNHITEIRRKAASLAARARAIKLPRALAQVLAAFFAAQKAYEAAAQAVDAAEEASVALLARVHEADAKLDASIDALVTELVGAKLGTRAQPLKGFTTKTPSALKEMAYAEEPDEADRAVKKILAKKPPPAS